MHTALQPRQARYRFENLPSLTRAQVAVWNWYCHIVPNRQEWTSWLTDILGHLLEHPAGLQLQLIETHMVDADLGEKVLTFGSKSELFIGRGEECDVVLPAKAIANKHARLIVGEGQLCLEDLGGKLGTYLWDKRIPAHHIHPLRDGDQFSVFPHRFRVALQKQWRPETEINFDQCRVETLRRAEFMAMSPAGWRVFVVKPHPEGECALLEMSPAFLQEVRQRILGPLKMEKAEHTVPSDDTLLAFVMLALLERMNRQLKFPVQFSFERSSAKTLADNTRGMLLSSAVCIGGLSGEFRIFLPLDFLSKRLPNGSSGWQGDGPAGLSWKFPVSLGFVDLLPDEIAQIGLGDILVAESATQALFPGDFSKGWALSADQSNSAQYTVDNYLERSLPVETGSQTAATENTPDVGSLPIRLHVVVGEKEFTLAEVQSLSPGTIVELEVAKSDPVRLMVNGRILGEGELVDVEGKLAVKVLGWKNA
jgi:flagellar motor switch protein FliN